MTSPADLQPDELELTVLLAGAADTPAFDLDGVLERARWAGAPRRRRVGVGLTAALAVAVLVIAVCVAWTISPRTTTAEPGAPTGASGRGLSPSPTDRTFVDSHLAALYLARLSGRTPTSYYGSDGVSARLRFGSRANVPADGVDLEITLHARESGGDPTAYSCAGARLSRCQIYSLGSTRLVTGVALMKNGCCGVRGTEVNVARYLRQDGTEVTVDGAPDLFTVDQLTAIATDDVWDVYRRPSDDDRHAASELSPWEP